MEYGHGDVGNGMTDPKPVDDNEFAEFMWMGEELDEFDQQVEQQLMEEFLLETCVEQMLRDEDGEEPIPPDLHVALNAEMLGSSTNPGVAQDAASIASRMADLSLASRSRLNPNAAVFELNPNASVFVPRTPAPPPTTEAKSAEGSSPPTDQVKDASSSANEEESKSMLLSQANELIDNQTSHDIAATEAPAEAAPDADAPNTAP